VSLRVLVTGANGFVGSALLRAAAAQGWTAVGLVRRPIAGAAGVRVCDYSVGALQQLVAELKPDCIAHAAGSASVAGSLADPGADFASSVALTQRLLEAVRASGARARLVYMSSAAVYGNPASLPVAESAPLAPISPYGFHKLVCERLFEEYAACYGQSALCVRAFSLLGEGQRRLLVWDVFDKARGGGAVELGGTGGESRDYLHVDDFAPLLWRAAVRHEDGFRALNVASGRAVTVREVAERVLAAAGSRGPLRFSGLARAGDPREWRADVSCLEQLIGPLALPAFQERLGQVVRAWSA